MRRAVIFAIGLFLVAAVGVAYVTRAGASVTAPPGKFSNLRVCSSTAFSRSQGRCTKDERNTVLVSNRISCSVDLAVRRPGLALRRRWTYEGKVVPYPPWRLGKTGNWYFWINEDLKINLPLPGGRWGCSFSFGSVTVKATFVSGGPTGEIVNTAACRRENTVAYPSGNRVCRSDESAAPMQATNSVWCYAAYPSDTGRLARLAIVSGGQILEEVSFTVGGPLWFGSVFTSAPTGQTLPAGSYSCEYSLDGVLVTQKAFELLG